jgi:creatinine amidohydrolase
MHNGRSNAREGIGLICLRVYTGIWWYAKFPNQYQGDSSEASAERGKALTEMTADRIANAIQAIKSDQVRSKAAEGVLRGRGTSKLYQTVA